ncbi:hypothetical protein H1R20_g10251, partial [Candolleomyces eurysporus]
MVDPLLDPSFNLFQGADMMSYSDMQPQTMTTFGSLSHTSMYDDLVHHYFDRVSKIQFVFAGKQLSDVTYRVMSQEPRGAPTFAIYALGDLHLTQLRIAEGLEAPQSGGSSAHYLYQEALFKLKANRDNGSGWSESDAIAALHLVSYSHLSGGSADWQEPFDILCAWLLQSNLSLAGENMRTIFLSMSDASQLLVKLIMWLDIFSSLSFMRPPKFLNLWKSLLDDRNGSLPGLDMASLTGCADDTLLAMAEISALAQWKATQVRNATLSYPELVGKGMKIQDSILRHKATEEKDNFSTIEGLAEGDLPNELHRAMSISIFRESALLYLHTILSNSTPAGVAEISSSVDEIVRRLDRLRPSNLDRALVFPICLAGCMTNDSNKRDYLKGRLQGLNETYGNLLQTRLLMEALWQRRDVSVSGEPVDMREIMRDQQLTVLLL